MMIATVRRMTIIIMRMRMMRMLVRMMRTIMITIMMTVKIIAITAEAKETTFLIFIHRVKIKGVNTTNQK